MVTLIGGLAGMILAYALAAFIGPIPFMSAMFDDDTGKADILLAIDPSTLLVSFVVLTLVGILSGVAPAVRAAGLDPARALHYE